MCHPAPLCCSGAGEDGQMLPVMKWLDVILHKYQEEMYFLSPCILMLSVYTDLWTVTMLHNKNKDYFSPFISDPSKVSILFLQKHGGLAPKVQSQTCL